MVKEESYKWAAKQVKKQVKKHVDITATLANTAAILKERFPDTFWVGFYLKKEDHLLLGPFQGPQACVKLGLDKGVCADCAKTKQTIIVANVSEYPGHVACDARSRSEIVVPLLDSKNRVQAVLDVDSTKLNDFDKSDARGLETIASILTGIWTGEKNHLES